MDDTARPDGSTPDADRQSETPPPTRRAYSKPVLTDYGTVSALTRGGVGTRSDGRGAKKFIAP